MFFSKNNIRVLISPPVSETETFFLRVRVGGKRRGPGPRPGGGRAWCGLHIWTHHRLCAAIGCWPDAAACQQDGLPPAAVSTLIISVSPRTYRKSLWRFKIDSGRAAAQSPDRAHMHPDLVGAADKTADAEAQPPGEAR